MTPALLGIVAIDDALGITLFSVLVAVATVVTRVGEATTLLWSAVREIGGGEVALVRWGEAERAADGRDSRSR